MTINSLRKKYLTKLTRYYKLARTHKDGEINQNTQMYQMLANLCELIISDLEMLEYQEEE